MATIGNTDVVGLDLSARGVEIAVGDLAPKRRVAEGGRVAQTALFGARHDPLHRAVKSLARGLGHAWTGDSKRNQVRVVDTVENPLHQGP